MDVDETTRSFIEDISSQFVDDHAKPEQWLSRLDGFNSQMGGYRASVMHPELDRDLFAPEQGLLGMLRGLEHPTAQYADILELHLQQAYNSDVSENVATLRYRMPPGVRTAEDVEAVGLQTARSVITYTVETLSNLDFDHPMAGTMPTAEMERIDITGVAGTRPAYDLSIPMDLAADIVCSEAGDEALREVAFEYENYLAS